MLEKTSYIKLKADLVFREVEDSVVIKDTVNGSNYYFKAPKVTFPLFSQLAIGANLENLLKYNQNHTQVMRLLIKLADRNLLEGFEASKSASFSEDGNTNKGFYDSILKCYRSIFFLKVFEFNPDPILRWIYDQFRISMVYRNYFLVPALIYSIIAATALFTNDFFGYSPSLPEQKLVYSISFYSLFILGVFIHELAHSLTCVRWGGEVKSIGMMLFYFFPAGFSNISDSYLMEKSKRITILIAGPLTTVFIGLLLGTIWLFTPKGTFFNTLVYYLALVSFIAPLFSLNPLLKYDGYYIISELIGIKNLRGRSFRYLRYLLEKAFLPGSNGSKRSNIPLNMKITYLLFGILASVYTAYILYLVFSMFINKIVTLVLFIFKLIQ